MHSEVSAEGGPIGEGAQAQDWSRWFGGVVSSLTTEQLQKIVEVTQNAVPVVRETGRLADDLLLTVATRATQFGSWVKEKESVDKDTSALSGFDAAALPNVDPARISQYSGGHTTKQVIFRTSYLYGEASTYAPAYSDVGIIVDFDWGVQVNAAADGDQADYRGQYIRNVKLCLGRWQPHRGSKIEIKATGRSTITRHAGDFLGRVTIHIEFNEHAGLSQTGVTKTVVLNGHDGTMTEITL